MGSRGGAGASSGGNPGIGRLNNAAIGGQILGSSASQVLGSNNYKYSTVSNNGNGSSATG